MGASLQEFNEDTHDYLQVQTPKSSAKIHDSCLTNEQSKKKEVSGNLVSFRTLFQYADKYDIWLMLCGTVGGIVSGVLQPIQIIVFGDIIDAFTTIEASEINRIALKFVWLAIGALVSGYGQAACWTMTASRQVRRIREEYVAALMRQNIGWFDMSDPNNLATKVAEVSVTIEDGMGRKVGDGLQFAAMFVAGVIIGLIKGWKLALILLAFTPVLAASAFIMMKVIAEAIQGGAEAYARAGSIAEEALANIKTIQSFNATDITMEKYDDALGDATKSGVKKGISVGLGVGGMFFSCFCTYAIGMYFGAVFVAKDNLDGNSCTGTGCYTGGTVLTVFFAIIMGAMALGQAGPSFQAMAASRAAAYDVFELISRVPEIDSSSKEGKVLSEINGDIDIENVDFRYPSRPEVQICKNYSLHIKAGQTVALVGASGCGKSTIVSLLERFYDPEKGSVRIDGHDIRDLNLEWLRKRIGLVGQEPALFACSIAENIRYGREDATRDDIENAARMANAYDFIKAFPDGFDTEVGPLGSQLSGGQKQRIAIARAIVKNPSILLLDEATSALDTESERIVQESLDRLVSSTKRTTIVIAHRLSTIQDADCIAVLREGHVAELGNHSELMSLPNGEYRHMVELQSDPKKNINSPLSPASKALVNADKENIKVVINVDKTDEKSSDSTEVEEEFQELKASRIWALSKPDLWYVVVGSCAAMVNGATYPIWGVLLTKVTVLFFKDISGDEMKSEALDWSIAFLVLGAAYAISTFLQNWCFAVVGENVTRALRSMGLKAMLQQNIAWFDDERHSSGSLTTRLATDVTLVQTMTGDMLNRTLVNLFTLGIAFGIGFYYSWQMTLAMLAIFPLLGVSSYVQMQMINGTGNSKTANSGDTKAGSIVSEAVRSIRTVVSFGMEKQLHTAYREFLGESSKEDIKKAVWTGFGFGVAQFISVAVLALLFYIGGVLVTDPDSGVDFQDMFMVLMAVMLGSIGLGVAAQGMVDASKAKKAARNIFGIIDRKPPIDVKSNEGARPTNVNGSIEFRNVGFAYPARPLAKIYRNYSLKIEEGTTVALVGASGGGKSTAIGLIERFYDPDAGEVLLDGKCLNDLNVKWLRDHISLVSQEPCLFTGTIADNIKFGKKDATHEEIVEAAKKANAHTFIMQFPQQYDTEVGDNGVQVSGGQKQRIAIARAIIRDPEVLLLDEATSALDTESERIVQESLDNLLKLRKRTTIVIAHRLSTIRNADKIAVVFDGEIVELGSHEELMGIEGGHYAALVARQEEH